MGLKSIGAWLSGRDLFPLAVLFALGGHLVFDVLLSLLHTAGLDFALLDKSRAIVPALQIALFAAQTALMVYALIQAGIPRIKTYVGVTALLFAAAMLMITFVALQCRLYGECL